MPWRSRHLTRTVLPVCGLLVALFLSLPAIGQRAGTEDKEYIDNVHQKLGTEIRALAAQSYSAEGPAVVKAVARNRPLAVPLNLAAGVNYAIVAACDQDCRHVSIELVDASNKVLAKSTEAHHTVLLGGSPEKSGPHTARVSLLKCSEQECYVGVMLARQGVPTAQPPPVTPAPPPARAFKTIENFDLVGVDLRVMKDVQPQACAQACANNDQCMGYSADKWNRYCVLKSKVVSRRLDPRASSGFVDGGSEPLPVTTPAQMLRLRGKAFPWAGQHASEISTFEECENKCSSSGDCVAFTFFKARQLCRLMETTGEYFSDSKADSGIKQQDP